MDRGLGDGHTLVVGGPRRQLSAPPRRPVPRGRQDGGLFLQSEAIPGQSTPYQAALEPVTVCPSLPPAASPKPSLFKSRALALPSAKA